MIWYLPALPTDWWSSLGSSDWPQSAETISDLTKPSGSPCCSQRVLSIDCSCSTNHHRDVWCPDLPQNLLELWKWRKIGEKSAKFISQTNGKFPKTKFCAGATLVLFEGAASWHLSDTWDTASGYRNFHNIFLALVHNFPLLTRGISQRNQ